MDKGFHSTIIPRSFQLAGYRIDVHFDGTLAERQLLAQGQFLKQTILLDPGSGQQQMVEQLYVYQLVDWILHMMGEDNLREKRGRVKCFAHLLYQALITMEFRAADEDPCRDEYETAGYATGGADYDPSHDVQALEEEWAEQEERRREMEEETDCWTDDADSWARAEEDGWFYDDED